MSKYVGLHHHHHYISFMQLGHLLTRSDLTYPEVSSKVYHDSFCQLGSSIALPWVIYFEAFYLHVISSFSCIPVICPKLVLFLTPLQLVQFFCNLSKCILLEGLIIAINCFLWLILHCTLLTAIVGCCAECRNMHDITQNPQLQLISNLYNLDSQLLTWQYFSHVKGICR